MKQEELTKKSVERGLKALPVLGNVEGPLEFEMTFLVVVDEGANCGVVTASEHARRSIFFSN